VFGVTAEEAGDFTFWETAKSYPFNGTSMPIQQIVTETQSVLVLRSIQMIQSYHNRLARPPGPRSARPEDKPCAGHPRKPARLVPRLVDAHGTRPWAEGPRAEPGHDDRVNRLSESEH